MKKKGKNHVYFGNYRILLSWRALGTFAALFGKSYNLKSNGEGDRISVSLYKYKGHEYGKVTNPSYLRLFGQCALLSLTWPHVLYQILTPKEDKKDDTSEESTDK